MARQEIRVPDLEGSTDVGVVEVYISAGDTVEIETPLISLESDKAVMDIPSPMEGKILELKISEGDTVNTGDLVAVIETVDSVTEVAEATGTPAPVAEAIQEEPPKAEPPSGTSAVVEIKVPDLEGSTDVQVVELYVSAGDSVEEESPLISLESDKAVMDVPSPVAGKIIELRISEGDTVNTGDVIAIAESVGDSDIPGSNPTSEVPARNSSPAESGSATPAAKVEIAAEAPVNAQALGAASHATPSVRALARELGVNLQQVSASGPKGRVTKDDLTSLVKSVMSGAAAATGASAGTFGLPPIPSADYASFGDISVEELSRIKKISGPHLHRNWVGVPHVTQFEDADITDMEAFRKDLNVENSRTGAPKVSPLIFIIKAVAKALGTFPDFNSSLNPDGKTITRKNYINIGIAVDTPGGLMVPIIRDADRKGVLDLAAELANLSARAREGKLKADELKGGTFSISSLGGIGGTYFTPIVNAPEVAILGLSRSSMKPVWNGSDFDPRLILPFSVSYDHRVIDGAQGARFAAYLSGLIADLRRALL